LKKSHKTLSMDYKKLAEVVEKASKEYLFFITEGRQNPRLGTVYNMYADYLTKVAEVRNMSNTHFNLINEEWRGLSRTDLKQIEGKLDQANKCLVSRQYYESNKDSHNAKEWDSKYATLITDFVKLLHDLREKKETLHPQFILRSLQAEMIMVRAVLKECELCAAAVLQFGPVEPIKAEIFRLVPKDPYPMSEEEKKNCSLIIKTLMRSQVLLHLIHMLNMHLCRQQQLLLNLIHNLLLCNLYLSLNSNSVELFINLLHLLHRSSLLMLVMS